MDPSTGTMAALALGFLLGLKHATDADHIVAVSTIVGRYRNVWRGIWVGASWGLGHTIPLLIIGVIVLIFKQTVLDQYSALAPILEFGVGIMLVILGTQVFWNVTRGRLHLHEHEHDNKPHFHIHGSHSKEESTVDESTHGFFHFGKPIFRFRSFTIGFVHGLAGSAAIMIILLPTLASLWTGIGYLVIFGLGTVLSMGLLTVILSIPFAVTSGNQKLNLGITIAAGIASVVFGIVLMTNIVTAS